MRIVEPSVDIITDTNPFKVVEKVGRLCYKSEDKITSDSYITFVTNLIKRKHYAMLEHGRVIFSVLDKHNKHYKILSAVARTPYVMSYNIKLGPDKVWCFTVSLSHLYNPEYHHIAIFHKFRRIVESKYLPASVSIYENIHDLFSDITLSKYYTDKDRYPELCDVDCLIALIPSYSLELSPEAVKHLTWTTLHFVCDRGISHELVRHRCSVAQESTRYCNYSKDKFGKEIAVIKPTNIEYDSPVYSDWETSCLCAERMYFSLLERGEAPQVARSVLPTSLKTEVILTMSNYQWQHFLELRSLGTTGAPHPDMKVVADKAQDILRKYL